MAGISGTPRTWWLKYQESSLGSLEETQDEGVFRDGLSEGCEGNAVPGLRPMVQVTIFSGCLLTRPFPFLFLSVLVTVTVNEIHLLRVTAA